MLEFASWDAGVGGGDCDCDCDCASQEDVGGGGWWKKGEDLVGYGRKVYSRFCDDKICNSCYCSI